MKTFPTILFPVTAICIISVSGLRPPQAIKDSVCGQCRVAGRKCYNTGQDWCCMCPAGHYLSEPCRLHQPETTTCTPCEKQTYMPDGNNETSCIKSRVSCDELPYTTLENGNTTRDNRCVCIAGTFSSTDTEDSGGCKPHLKCPEGFGVIKYGNSTHDVECGRCRDGTFSNLNSSTRKCQPFRKCQNGEKVTFAGNSKQNRECSTIVSVSTDLTPPVSASSDATTTSQQTVSHPGNTDAQLHRVEENGTAKGLVAVIVILVILIFAVIVFFSCCCKRKKKCLPKGLNKHHDDKQKSEDLDEKHEMEPLNPLEHDKDLSGLKKHHDDKPKSEDLDEKHEMKSLVPKSQSDSEHDEDFSGGLSPQNGSNPRHGDGKESSEVLCEDDKKQKMLDEVFDEPKEFEEPLQALPDVNKSPELKKKPAPVFGEFEKNFQSKGFRVIYDPKKDGNCQFSAAAKFLHTDHRRLRRAVVAELERNEHQYSEFIDTDRYANYGEYVKQMSKEGEYGDHLTLKIISKLYNVVFTIIQTSNDTPITINESNGPDMYILGHISEDDGMHYVCLESLERGAEQDMESSSARQPSSDARLGDDASTSAAATSVRRDGAVEEAQRTPRETVSQRSGDVSQGTRETGHESASNDNDRDPQAFMHLLPGDADEQNSDLSSSQSRESFESAATVQSAEDQSDDRLDRHTVPLSTYETQQNGPDASRQSPEMNTHETHQRNNPRVSNQPSEGAGGDSAESRQSSVGRGQDLALSRSRTARDENNMRTVYANGGSGTELEMALMLFNHQADIEKIREVPERRFLDALKLGRIGREILIKLKDDINSDSLKNFIRYHELLLELEIEDIIVESGSSQSEMRRKLLRKIIEKKGRELTPRFLLEKSKEYDIRIIYDTLCKAFIENITQEIPA